VLADEVISKSGTFGGDVYTILIDSLPHFFPVEDFGISSGNVSAICTSANPCDKERYGRSSVGCSRF